MKNSFAFTRLIKSAFLITSLIAFVSLQGCSDSDDPVAVVDPDQDASGLYNGSALLDGDTVTPADLIGIVHDNRFIIFSATENLLIDGTMTVPTGSSYTATADVYETGVKTQTAISVTGTVTTESSLTATLSGTGLADGTINLLFDPLYNRGATFARTETSGFDVWANAPTYSVNTSLVQFIFDNLGVYGGTNTVLIGCQYTNGIALIPSSMINVYTMSNDVIDSNSCGSIGTGYTGFASVVDGISTDDTLLYAVTNGTNSVFAVLTK